MMIEEGERPVRRVGFEPERGLRQFDGHRILVNAVATARDDIAQCMAIVAGRRVAISGAELGEFLREPARRSEQKMARAARRVANGDGEQGANRFLRIVLQRPLDHRVERGLDQRLHQAVRRVVRAGEFAGVAFRRAAVAASRPHPRPLSRRGERWFVADEGETARGYLDHRHEFEQALVNAAEFLRVHVAVIDARQAAGLAKETEIEQRRKQPAVFDLRAFQVRAAVGGEEPAQRGQSERRLASGEAAEGNR